MNKLTIIPLMVFIILILSDIWIFSRKRIRTFRKISAIEKMHYVMESSVEDGSRIHFSIGRSEVTSPEIAVGLIGLNILKRISNITTNSDLPPIASTGTGSLMVLAQDNIKTIYSKTDRHDVSSNLLGRFSGPTPLSFAASSAMNLSEDKISTNLMVGSFGIEAGLLTHTSDNGKTLSVAGTENLLGQAVLYVTAHESLIGEEVFASNAYLESKDIHRASLFSQDVFRIFIITGMTIISILGLIQGLF